MRSRSKAASERLVAHGNCHHYWLIESANAPTRKGICKLCGAEREFENYLPDSSIWDSDISFISGLFHKHRRRDLEVEGVDSV